MASKNSGYIEELPDDASIGLIEDVKRKASAIQESAKVTSAVEQVEVSKQQSEITDGARKEAGAKQEAKFAEGTVEGKVASEILTSSPGIQIASVGLQALQEGSTNPSKGKDVAKAVKGGARSMEDGFSDMKKAPIKTPVGRSMTEKMATSETSMGSLVQETTGVQADESVVASTTHVGQIKQVLDFGISLANEQALQRAIALKAKGPAGPGGMGSNAPGMNHDRMGQGPKPPTHLNEDEEALV